MNLFTQPCNEEEKFESSQNEEEEENENEVDDDWKNHKTYKELKAKLDKEYD